MSVVWPDLSIPWRACLEEAWEAYRAGSIPIGAVVTDAEGRIVSRGRNRIHETHAPTPYIAGSRLAHAEVNALAALDPHRADPRSCTLYTTTEPCPLCTGAIRMMRLSAVRYAARDAAAGSVGLLEGSPYMRRNPVAVIGPENRALEEIVTSLHVAFSLGHEETPAGWWAFEAWRATVPRGVSLGEELFASGRLARMREEGMPASGVIDELAARLRRSETRDGA